MIRLAALLATIALLAGAALGRQAPAVRTRVLYPVNRSFHTRAVMVIVVTPASASTLRATLNGKPLTLRRMRFAEGWVLPGSLEATAKAVGDRRKAVLWVGNVADRPGRYALSVPAASAVNFQIGKGSPPSGWSRAYVHPPIPAAGGSSPCNGCHAMPGDRLDSARYPDSCRCHGESAVQLAHKHVVPPLTRCAMCHDPHGATRARLLVAPKEKLCIRCHAAGRSK